MMAEVVTSAEVGRRLRALREARGMRREQLALALAMGSENLRQRDGD